MQLGNVSHVENVVDVEAINVPEVEAVAVVEAKVEADASV